MNRIPYVQGRCPACGHEVLILGEGGYVTCSLIDCPDPEAVTKMLERKDGIVLGQMVHYVSHGTPVREDGTQAFPATCRAAVITDMEQEYDPATRRAVVSLCVLNPTGMFFTQHLEFRPDTATLVPGTWHASGDHYA